MADQTNYYTALLGNLLAAGVQLPLRGGLNFVGINVTPSQYGYDVSLPTVSLGGVTYLSNQDVSGTYPTSTVFSNCRIVGAVALTGTATFRDCKCTGAFSITATAIEVDRASAYAILAAHTTVSVLPTNLEPDDQLYGCGGDGDLAVSGTDTTTLAANGSQTKEFNSITLTGAASLQNAGRAHVIVRNLLDLSAAPAGALMAAVGAGGNAVADAAGASGGAGNSGLSNGGPGNLSAAAGIAGNVSTGTASAGLTGLRHSAGGNGGACGASGTGVAAGVATQAGGAFTRERNGFYSLSYIPTAGPGATNATTGTSDVIWGGHAGRSGSSGGGDSSAAKGGGGGGSGTGGGWLVVRARGIKLTSTTPAGTIKAQGGAGGNGGNGGASGSATGGGAGAGGSGGGLIVVYYEWLIGSASVNSVCDASGGAGGNGGNGNGSGASTGGDGGSGGDGGQIMLINTITRARTLIAGSAGTAGTAHTGANGGPGGAGGACVTNFPALPG